MFAIEPGCVGLLKVTDICEIAIDELPYTKPERHRIRLEYLCQLGKTLFCDLLAKNWAWEIEAACLKTTLKFG